mgnify:CR=1 FL=1
MFTGIVEETGSIRSLRLSGSSGKIAIRAKKVLGGTRIGDSIAVNGVCLTVVSLEKDGFTADVMAETVRRTNLGDTKIGEKEEHMSIWSVRWRQMADSVDISLQDILTGPE